MTMVDVIGEWCSSCWSLFWSFGGRYPFVLYNSILENQQQVTVAYKAAESTSPTSQKRNIYFASSEEMCFSKLQYLIQAVNTGLVHVYVLTAVRMRLSCLWKQMFAVGSTTENEEVT